VEICVGTAGGVIGPGFSVVGRLGRGCGTATRRGSAAGVAAGRDGAAGADAEGAATGGSIAGAAVALGTIDAAAAGANTDGARTGVLELREPPMRTAMPPPRAAIATTTPAYRQRGEPARGTSDALAAPVSAGL
jgi:hypothetical protein